MLERGSLQVGRDEHLGSGDVVTAASAKTAALIWAPVCDASLESVR